MKMKKISTILVLFVFLCSILSVIAAPSTPIPVRFTLEINGEKANFDDVKVTNLATGEVLTKSDIGQLTMENGICGFDLSQFKQGYTTAVLPYYIGDEIEVKICDIHPDCTFSFNVDSSLPPPDFWFNTKITTSDHYVCWDSSVVSDPNDCPAQPTPEPDPTPEVEAKVSSIDSKTAKVEAYYGQEIDIKIGDNKLASLIDDVIDFNGEDYDVQEEIYFKAKIQTSLDDEDFELEPYILIEENGIEYRYVFVDKIDLSEISEDEELEIGFLGKNLRIVEANSNSITLRTGEEYFIKEGEIETIEGSELKVVTIGEDSVLIDVDGYESIVDKDSSETFGNLNVYVNKILYKSYEESHVELLVGTDTDEEISNGDDYEADKNYKWVIDLPSHIGITNQEEYKYLDEENTPLKIGDSIKILDYIEIKFKEITTSDRVSMKFKVRDGYLNVRGDLDDSFVYSSEDYKELYVNSNGIYDEDKEMITTDKIRIGDSDTYLELGSVKIGKLEIKLDMSDILYDGVSFSSKDRDYLDYFGLIFKDPEQGIDDKNGFEVSVPEERPEVVITFSSEISEDIEDVVEPFEPVVEPTEPVVPVEPVTPTEPVVEPVTPVEPTEPVIELVTPETPEEGNNLLTVLITLIAGIIGMFAWGKGFAGLIKYYLRKGQEARKEGDKELAEKYEARASKMAKTVVTNFLAGKYKK